MVRRLEGSGVLADLLQRATLFDPVRSNVRLVSQRKSHRWTTDERDQQ